MHTGALNEVLIVTGTSLREKLKTRDVRKRPKLCREEFHDVPLGVNTYGEPECTSRDKQPDYV